MNVTVGIMGAGKVGTSLGKYFRTRDIPVSGYFSRTPLHAQSAAEFTQTRCFSTLEELVEASEVLFLTVPDGSISACYQALPVRLIPGKIICHCSGALPAADAFPGIRAAGAFGYSVHPLFAVSDPFRSYRELSDVFFCVEGDPARLDVVLALLKRCGNPVQVIDPSSKVRYHAAAAVVSNHVVALVAESLSLLESCGFSREGALTAIRPLLTGNVTHLAQEGPVASLTGPVERCDTGTVAKHLAAMPSEEERELYRLLSARLVRVAEEKHPDRDYAPMKNLLKENCHA